MVIFKWGQPLAAPRMASRVLPAASAFLLSLLLLTLQCPVTLKITEQPSHSQTYGLTSPPVQFCQESATGAYLPDAMNLRIMPNAGWAPLRVDLSFNVSLSNLSAVSGPYQDEIFWGDETSNYASNMTASSYGMLLEVTHTFDSVGPFTVRVLVCGSDGTLVSQTWQNVQAWGISESFLIYALVPVVLILVVLLLLIRKRRRRVRPPRRGVRSAPTAPP